MSEQNVIRNSKPFHDIPDITVAQHIDNALGRLDQSLTCVVDANTGSELTIGELLLKSKQLAKALADRGVTKTDLIITFAENSVELVIAVFASLFLGSTLYPITPVANVHELDQLFDTLQSIVVFTSSLKSKVFEKIADKYRKNEKLKLSILLDGSVDGYVTFDELVGEVKTSDLPNVPIFDVDSQKDIILMLQSSGTTGVPKSMMISNRAVLAGLLSFSDLPPFPEQLISCIMSPIACMSGLSVLIGLVITGSKTILFKGYDEELTLQAIEKYGIHLISILPAFGHVLADDDRVKKYNLSSLSLMFVTGAAFPGNIGRRIMDKYNIFLQELYGMTEYGALTLCPDMDSLEYIPGNLGRPANNTEMKVVDVNSGQNLGPDMDGEICVRGPKLFSGYLDNPEATREAIDSEGWFHTGDIGHYDSMNRVYITDRLKELIKWGTKQISPTELELFLLKHEAVEEVAVIGVRHKTQTQWPRAYVKCAMNKTVTEEELKKFVEENLSEHKQLRAGIVFVDHIQRSTVGKVDRRYYKKLVANELIETE